MVGQGESLLKEFEKIPQGTHLCSIYKNTEEQFSIVVPFFQAGLHNGEKCLYIVDENTKEEVTRRFKAANIDLELHIKAGHFEFFHKEETYLKEGYFEPEKMITLLKAAQAQALKEGYSGLRATGEMTWIFTKLPGVEKLIEYETRLNYFFPGSKTTAVCQYNENKFSPQILLDIVHAHPKVIIYNSICTNPYYIPPDELLARLKGEIRKGLYEMARDDILERSKREKEHARLQQELNSIARFPSENPSPILRVSKDGTLLYGNLAAQIFLREWGCDIGRKVPEFVYKLITDSLNTNSMKRDVEVGYKHQIFSFVIVPILENNYVNLYGRDITEHKRMEKAVWDAEIRYRMLFEQSPDGILTINPDTTLPIEFNDVACQQLGYSRDEFAKLKIFDYEVKEGREEVKKHIEKVRYQGRDTFETKHRAKSGELRNVLVMAKRIRLGEKDIIFYIYHDITDYKRAEELLMRSNRAIRVLSECDQFLLFAENENELLVKVCASLVNTGKYRMSWVGIVEYAGQKNVVPVAYAGYEDNYLKKAVIRWDDSKYASGPTGIAVKSGKPYVCRNIQGDASYAAWCADAIKRGYASSAAIPISMGGKITHVINIYASSPSGFNEDELNLMKELANDIGYGLMSLKLRAEHQRAEEQIRQAAEEWQTTFDAIPDLVFILDTKHTMLRVNRVAAERLGLKPEEIVGKKCYEVMHKADKPWPACPLEITAIQKAPATAEVEEPNLGATFLVTTSPVFHDGQEIIRIVHIARDISILKENEKEMKKRIRELEIFHKAAVKRELVMIGLKKKIKEMEERIAGGGLKNRKAEG